MPRFSLLIAFVAVIAIIYGQTSCPCDETPQGSCSKINLIPQAPSTCVTTTEACNGCRCIEGGSLICNVVPSVGLEFTGQGNQCALIQKLQVECP
mmetsp:Transcript_7622/g.18809  ORF Transcript_7622/g.18809 Transcript_7622/m.18809 type:complete len:95 (+) Transcript_7622:107-391(+)